VSLLVARQGISDLSVGRHVVKADKRVEPAQTREKPNRKLNRYLRSHVIRDLKHFSLNKGSTNLKP
jgi:hypothetical protein